METIDIIFERHITCTLNQSGVYVGSMSGHTTVWVVPKLDGSWGCALTPTGHVSEMPALGQGQTAQEAFDQARRAAGGVCGPSDFPAEEADLPF